MINIFADWRANTGNIKGKLIMVLFRINQIAAINRVLFFFMIPYLVFYRFLVEWLMGVELPWKTTVGAGLSIKHGQSLVINDKTTIGSNVILRQSTTIGNKKLLEGRRSACPVIGNNVDVGSNVCIIGDITIGENSIIGAGSVVVKDVPSNVVVAGNPAKIIKYL